MEGLHERVLGEFEFRDILFGGLCVVFLGFLYHFDLGLGFSARPVLLSISVPLLCIVALSRVVII